MEYSQFEDLIMQTQCNETNLVTNAQTIILSLYHQNITHFVSLSIQTLSFHHNIQAQCFVLLKLRDGFVYRTNPQSILFSLPHEQISELRVCLSNVLLDPTANDLTKRLTADAIAEFGITSYLTDQSFWPDIVPFLLHVAHDSDPSNRKYALRGMIAVVYDCSKIVIPHLNQLIGLILNCFTDCSDRQVQLKAAELLSSIVQSIPKEDPLFSSLHTLIPHLLTLLTSCLDERKNEDSCTILRHMIDIIQKRPTFFGEAMMTRLLPGMFTIIGYSSAPLTQPSYSPNKINQNDEHHQQSIHSQQIRFLCLEFVSIATTGSADQVKKTFFKNLSRSGTTESVLPGFITIFLTSVVGFMLEFEEPEDEEDWMSSGQSSIDDSESVLGRCVQVLERVSSAIKPKDFFDLFAQLVMQLVFFNADGQSECQTAYRHHVVANYVISGCVVGLFDKVKDPTILQSLLSLVLQSLSKYPQSLPEDQSGATLLDFPAQLEAYSAVYAINTLAQVLQKYFVVPFQSTLLDVLLKGLSSYSCYPVVHKTLKTIIFLFSEDETKSLSSLSIPIASRLTAIIHKELTSASVDPNSPETIRNLSLRALTTVLAVSTEDDAVQMLPYLFETLAPIANMPNITSNSDRKFQGQAVQALSSLLLSVGTASDPYLERFTTIMTTLAESLQQTNDHQYDDRTGYLKDSWLNISQLLKSRFVVFLPTVLPPLLQSAGRLSGSLPSQISGLLSKITENAPVATGINDLLAREEALSILCQYAITLGPHFAPYVPDCLKVSLAALEEGVPSSILTNFGLQSDQDDRSYYLTTAPLTAATRLVKECIASLMLAIVAHHNPHANVDVVLDEDDTHIIHPALAKPLPHTVLQMSVEQIAEQAQVQSPSVYFNSIAPYILGAIAMKELSYQEKSDLAMNLSLIILSFTPFLPPSHFPPLPYHDQPAHDPPPLFPLELLASFTVKQTTETQQFRSEQINSLRMLTNVLDDDDPDIGNEEDEAQEEIDAAGVFFSKLSAIPEALCQLYGPYFPQSMTHLFPLYCAQLDQLPPDAKIFRDDDDWSSAMYMLTIILDYSGQHAFQVLPRMLDIFVKYAGACALDCMKKKQGFVADESAFTLNYKNTQVWQNACFGIGIAAEKDMEWMKWLLLDGEVTPLQLVLSMFASDQVKTAMSTSFPTISCASLFYPSFQASVDVIQRCILIPLKNDDQMAAHETAVSALVKIVHWMEFVDLLLETVVSRKQNIQPSVLRLPPPTAITFSDVFLQPTQDVTIPDDPAILEQHVIDASSQLQNVRQQHQQLLAFWVRQLPLRFDLDEAKCSHNKFLMYSALNNEVILGGGNTPECLQSGNIIANILMGTYADVPSESSFSSFHRLVSTLLTVIRSPYIAPGSSLFFEDMFRKLLPFVHPSIIQGLWNGLSEERKAELTDLVSGSQPAPNP